tara:strand:+ start:3442 stop:3903 length:462 start_codon:yes stop_codon:yes gene_type:complete
MWHSGAGKSVTINEIMDEIQQHTDNGGGVFIGCDSQIVKNDCTFSSVICLHGATGQQGGFYFYARQKTKRSTYPTMVLRLLKEVELSIQLGFKIIDLFPDANIEIHIDANSKKEEATSKFADMLMGYAKGAGFECRIKPEAWASNSIADKHSK